MGNLRGRLDARGVNQIDSQYYDGTSTSMPIINATTIRIVLTLMLMGDLRAKIVDVKGGSYRVILRTDKRYT